MFISGVQHSDLVTHTCISIFCQILLPYGLLQNIEYISLCYTVVGPRWFILVFIAVWVAAASAALCWFALIQIWSVMTFKIVFLFKIFIMTLAEISGAQTQTVQVQAWLRRESEGGDDQDSRGGPCGWSGRSLGGWRPAGAGVWVKTHVWPQEVGLDSFPATL